MEHIGCAAVAADNEKIGKALDRLPPEYVRKVRVFAETLVQIFEGKREEGSLVS